MSAIALIASVFRSMSTVKRVHAQEHGEHKKGKCGRQGRCRRVILRSRYAPIDKDAFLVNISSEREDVYIYYSEAVWQFECLFVIVFFFYKLNDSSYVQCVHFLHSRLISSKSALVFSFVCFATPYHNTDIWALTCFSWNRACVLRCLKWLTLGVAAVGVSGVRRLLKSFHTRDCWSA